MVLVAFSFAHEDSKKRDAIYNISTNPTPSIITSTPTAPATNVAVLKKEKFGP